MPTNSHSASETSHIIRQVGLLVVVAIFLLIPLACRKRQTTTKIEVNSDKQCEEVLDSSFSMLQPDRLGISSDAETVAGLLNQWNRGCGTEVKDWVPAELPEELIKTLPGDDPHTTANSENYENRDVEQIRDALLMQQINLYALGDEKSDLERVLTLFRYTVRNIELRAEGDEVSGRPYEVLMLGKGTSKDRAWVFAELLREIKIDSVIISPKQSDNPDAWLLGVAAEKQLYLFDCQLGIPIPSPKTDGPKTKPATLQEVQQNPDILTKLGSEAKPHPLHGAELKAPHVHLIGNTSQWAQRMQKLSVVLTGDRSVEIHTSLKDTKEQPGQISRVLAVADGSFTEADLGLWSYPEQQILNFANPSSEDSKAFQEDWAVLLGPYERELNPVTQVVVFGKESRVLLSGRLAQLTGDYLSAIRAFQMVRLQSTFPVGAVLPRDMEQTHAASQENAAFWIGICQLEMNDIDAASNTFTAYLRTYTNPNWESTANRFLSYSRIVQMLPSYLR